MVDLVDAIARELHQFSTDDEIELITVNATKIGGSVLSFAAAPVLDGAGDPIAPVFGGVTYQVVPFESEGWDHTSAGTLPQPIIRFKIAREDNDQGSTAAVLLAMSAQLDHFLGAKVLRLRTMRQFLDDGATPDPQAHMGLEVYDVTRRSLEDPDQIEYQLQSALDIEDVVLPGQVLNFCRAVYRVYVPGAGFDYLDATCPYVDEVNLFTAVDEATADFALDRCSHQLSGCKARFGDNAILPFEGWPAVGKFRA